MAGPRARLIESAIQLVREQGVHAAGLAALLDRGKASRNSLYQHFPEGKSELVATATMVAGERLAAVIEKITASRPAQQWLDALIGWWVNALETSSFRTGCPIVGAALAESEPEVQAAAGAVFADWHEKLGSAMETAGLPAEESASLASFVFSAMEGAIVQARAMKSTQPLVDAQQQLSVLFDHYLGTAK
ncbi:TetR/AcrR family transcriptional regulator [Nocardia brasiliensis]|uniref:TetR/AcrR family transcriptional regulator n=1 Tax=Nocardia brasiliensis TaxID=37326 RepID=UPI001893E927|nr:TetR/AcrR family transcriptional regulator [Nocardia brasiliensis]MBF6544135.1 TetR/AcrR family transcriptional regulator [Nocardia brasiliensis]